MVTRPARTHCAGPSTTDCQPNYPRYPIHAHPVPDTRPTGTKNRTRSDGTVEIVLTVTYPDGTTEPATAKVTATPAPEDKEDDEAPKGKEDDEGDQPVVPNRLEAGGSSFGSS